MYKEPIVIVSAVRPTLGRCEWPWERHCLQARPPACGVGHAYNFYTVSGAGKYNLKKGVAFHYNGGGKVTAVAIEGII